MRIALLSAALPPRIDGIGDYTWCLSHALVRSGHEVLIVTGEPEPLPSEQKNLKIVGGFDFSVGSSVDAARRLLHEANPEWLWIQYNPFGFGKRGYCPQITRLARAVRERGRTKLLVNAHELFTEDTRLADRAMSLWQRYFTRLMVRRADLVTTSCEAYARTIKAWGVNAPVIPIGSNLPDPVDTAMERERSSFRIGTFGTAHPSRNPALMRDACIAIAKQRPVQFLFIGAGGALIKETFAGIDYTSTGSVTAPEASSALATLDLFLAPFADGISARRGSVIAALQHGLPVVTTLGPRTDNHLRKLDGKVLSVAKDSVDFVECCCALSVDSPRRLEFSASARDYFQEHLTWDAIAAKLLETSGSSTFPNQL